MAKPAADRVPRARPAPAGFAVERGLAPGPHPLLEVFPGLDRLPAFDELTDSPTFRRELARKVVVQLQEGPGWMYVAPYEQPPLLEKIGFHPFLSKRECVVVARRHLTRSARLLLYLDIFHELTHVVQRRGGVDLWEDGYRYADRPTEIEAYRFAIRLARELGVPDAFLREYLRVEWMSPAEHRLLLRNVGVPATDRGPARR
jgi:hypothetical protein